MYGRGGLARWVAADEPSLRLRRHPVAVVGRARLSEKRILGAFACRGASRPRTRSAFRPPYRRRDGRCAGCRAVDGHGRGARRTGEETGRRGAQTLRQGVPRHGDLGQTLLRRQPVFRLCDGGLQGYPSGGYAAQFDRQVRRRHRQLDVAAPYGRFLDVPHLRRQGQPSGGVFDEECPLSRRRIPAHFARRVRRGRFRHDHGLPRLDAAVHDLV